ncbi:MAG: YbaB/EbfC family nucleoid-associated protein [Patescibacteria group bacterium]|jgi:DNA-binding protein YbaB|nr:YbaB/EbfC family nucleoid-associated protein [Patescibacteria group bacterium]
MFNKLKQFKDLRSQAKTMQDALAGESVSIEKKGIKMTMNGNMEITELTIPEELNKQDISKYMKETVNEGIKKVQKLMSTKMQEMGGLSGLGM